MKWHSYNSKPNFLETMGQSNLPNKNLPTEQEHLYQFFHLFQLPDNDICNDHIDPFLLHEQNLHIPTTF